MPTSNKSARVPDEIWDAAKFVAHERGENLTDVIVRSLDLYARSGGWGIDPVTALERLAALHERGALTDEEFGYKKRELLDRI